MRSTSFISDSDLIDRCGILVVIRILCREVIVLVCLFVRVRVAKGLNPLHFEKNLINSSVHYTVWTYSVYTRQINILL